MYPQIAASIKFLKTLARAVGEIFLKKVYMADLLKLIWQFTSYRNNQQDATV
jgi:hypothetical protein